MHHVVFRQWSPTTENIVYGICLRFKVDTKKLATLFKDHKFKIQPTNATETEIIPKNSAPMSHVDVDVV
jgi:hypothetical protein